LVFAGLIASTLATGLIEAPQDCSLPGVALDSPALLVVERGLAFFAAWLLVLIVSVQALNGQLPIEVSGRGVRYAEAERTQDSLTETRDALRRIDAEVWVLRKLVGSPGRSQSSTTERVRMESDGE
jgi:hypothetical protein